LPAGTYYFGASYQALYKIGHGFIFMSETLPESNSAEACDAYAHLSDASLNDNKYGIKFTLNQETEVYLGWMADLTEGDATQEFRAKEVALLKYKETEGGGAKIEMVKTLPNFNTPAEYYTIAGTRLDKEPSQGFFIKRQNGNAFKIYNR
jgi:hypothetical protein